MVSFVDCAVEVGLWGSVLGEVELDVVEELAGAEGGCVYSKGGEEEERFGLEINRYLIGDALIRS